MKSLYEVILKRFLASSFTQIIVIGLPLLAAIFLLNNYQAEKNRQELEKISETTFKELAAQSQNNIRLRFEKAFLIAKQLQVQASEVFSIQGNFTNKNLNIVEDEGHFRNDFNGLSSVYTTNIRSLNEHRHRVMERLSLLVPLLRSSVENQNDLISSAWINIDKFFAARYPAFDVSENVPPTLDVTQYRFYYAADPKHNPDGKTVFLGLYQEPWALPLGEIAVFLTPIYANGEFIGVIGLNITVDSIAESILKVNLPLSSYLMLLDNDNTLIASSDEERAHQVFGTHSFYHYHRNTPDAGVNVTDDSHVDFSHINRETKVMHQQDIPMTDFKIRLCADRSDIYANSNAIYEEAKQVGFYLIGFIVLFSLLFYWLMFGLTKKLALYISSPLKDMVDFSRSLGTSSNLTLGKSDINEFRTLGENLIEANQRLSNMLIVDSLTSLYNHKKLFFDLEKISEGTLILFAIDHFKRINSIYGTEGGDALLNHIAQGLQNIGCDETRVYRVSADTFALFRKKNSSLDSEQLGELVDSMHSDSFTYNDIEIEFTCSCGATIHDQESSRTLKEAEIALEEAKKTKRGSCVLYNDELQSSKEFEANLLWGRRVKDALRDDMIFPVFQPIYNLHTQKIEKLESLVRMRLDGEIIPPFRFLEPARNIGLLTNITRVMIDKVFEVAKSFPEMEFSLNVSFSDFQDIDMLDYIQERCAANNITPERIVFEVLETEALFGEKEKVAIFRQLKDAGFKIAIDDFGSGYSNFSHILNIRTDYIKIDGQFIKDIDVNANSHTIAKTIIEFSHTIKAKTIAEFVCSQEVQDNIAALGVDYLQGYHISPPVEKEKLIELVS